MTLEEAKKNYPIHKTLVGTYELRETIDLNDVMLDDDMKDTMFPAPEEGKMCFIRLMDGHIIECWTFNYARVAGYLVTDSTKGVTPMTYTEDFGWEEVYPNLYDGETYCFAPDEFGGEADLEDIAFIFDEEAYGSEIFTSFGQLENHYML
jgi:hypothetical protein